MRQFYATHTSPDFLALVSRELNAPARTGLLPILSQAVRELNETAVAERPGTNLSQAVRDSLAVIPWGHHANVLAKISDPAARLYYVRATAQCGWSRNVLLNQIKA